MIADYLTCPQMMLYKWILQLEEEDTFFAAVMGTAGHECIREMHQTRKFDYSVTELHELFYNFFVKACRDSKVPPKIGAQFATLDAQVKATSPEYISMLMGYQRDELNQNFYATCIEQPFVIELDEQLKQSSNQPTLSGQPTTSRKHVFTGTIDQAGYYSNGAFALRDIKFRANNFRPKGQAELNLNLQLSLYAYALKYGVPACSECHPVYSAEGELLYTGPCPTCKAKIGTKLWPQLISEKTELIWMRDYTPRKKDQYAKYITDPDGGTEINPRTGRRIKKRILNQQWCDGYKAGDASGPAHLIGNKSAAFLQVHMADIIRLSGLIKDAQFFRKSGEHCNFWCKHRESCVNMLELEVEEIDTTRLNEHIGTLDPFGDMG